MAQALGDDQELLQPKMKPQRNHPTPRAMPGVGVTHHPTSRATAAGAGLGSGECDADFCYLFVPRHTLQKAGDLPNAHISESRPSQWYSCLEKKLYLG